MRIFRNASKNLHRIGGPAVETKTLIQYFQEGKLHRSDGPAVEGKAGTRMYFWRGILVPTPLWKKRHKMSIKEILTYPNAEMRRVLVEIRGWERFVEEAGAKVLHYDAEREAYLYRVELPDADIKDEPVVVVRVTDATTLPDGSRRNYFIRVPPDKTTCVDAIAWTFQMTPEEYVLEVET